MNVQEIQEVLKKSLVDCLNEKGEPSTDVQKSSIIFGSGSIVDSMDLVGIIVNLEQTITERTGKTIEIVDESSVISDESPFRTIESLAAHVEKKLNA